MEKVIKCKKTKKKEEKMNILYKLFPNSFSKWFLGPRNSKFYLRYND